MWTVVAFVVITEANWRLRSRREDMYQMWAVTPSTVSIRRIAETVIGSSYLGISLIKRLITYILLYLLFYIVSIPQWLQLEAYVFKNYY